MEGDEAAATTLTTTATAAAAADDGVVTEWRKVLWAKQPYRDNYVPPDFLAQSRAVSSQAALPDLRTLIVWSLPLCQQSCITLTFVGLFLHLRQGTISAELLGSCSAVAIALCGMTMPGSMVEVGEEFSSSPSSSPPEAVKYVQAQRSARRRALAQPLSYALLGLVVLALSPLLKTLTEATTSDSIAALSTTLFLLSFALADFSGRENGETALDSKYHNPAKRRRSSTASERRSSVGGQQGPLTVKPALPATLSLNAALCASIVLASRLQSPIDVFSLVLSAIGLFGFLSRWLKFRRCGGSTTSFCLTAALLLASTSLLQSFSQTAAMANVGIAFFFSIGCPYWMRRAQKWKDVRSGPWQMGVPRLRLRPLIDEASHHVS